VSGEAAVTGELIAFDGAVDCQALTGAVNLRLRGVIAATARTDVPAALNDAGAAEVMFSGAEVGAVPIPVLLHQVRVLQLGPVDWGHAFRIQSHEGGYPVRARSVQLHWAAATAFFGALPPARAPRSTRWGWMLLLLLLRVPGAARLLAKLRG